MSTIPKAIELILAPLELATAENRVRWKKTASQNQVAVALDDSSIILDKILGENPSLNVLNVRILDGRGINVTSFACSQKMSQTDFDRLIKVWLSAKAAALLLESTIGWGMSERR